MYSHEVKENINRLSGIYKEHPKTVKEVEFEMQIFTPYSYFILL